MKLLLAALFAITPFFAHATPYMVDYTQSSVEFAGEHVGNPFTGTFQKWNADINFDTNDLAASHINARFDLSSAHTGNKLYDGTLPNADWFDVAQHPQGVFETTSITQAGDGYHADGTLTLRGITHPVAFDFTLTKNADSSETAAGTLTIQRLDYAIGEESDATGEWVSKDITITLNITATTEEE